MKKRNRLKEFDYSQGYWYFVTVCVKDMKTYLGKIRNGKVLMNKHGKIVYEKWTKLSQVHTEVYLDEFIVMPNHFHGIITFDNDIVGTTHELSLRELPHGDKPKTLSYYLGKFKMQSSKAIHLSGLKNFKWQRSFYDRIIRNEKELNNIHNYIHQNPIKLEIEKSVPENLDI